MKTQLQLPADLSGNCWKYTMGVRSASILPPHRHDELEVNLVVEGSASYLVDDRKYDLQPGDLLWLFPAQEHLLLNESPDFRMWILVWKPQLLRECCRHQETSTLLTQRPDGEFCRRLSGPEAMRLRLLFDEIASAQHERDRFNAGLAYALTLAWAMSNDNRQTSMGSDVHPCVEKAARLIRIEAEPPGLEVLSRRVGLSPSRLSRLFKQQTGVSISQFANRQRLERFFHIYGNGQQRSMGEAAQKAGFGSYPQFHRVFKSLTGKSPAAFYRK